MAINIYKHVDAASAGGGDGSTWALAGANAAYTEAEFEVFMEGAVVAGDVIFVKDGIYTLDSTIDWSARNGTAVSPILVCGVRAATVALGAAITYADWSRDAADRPFFDCVTFAFRCSQYNQIRNMSFQGEYAFPAYGANYNLWENCKFENDNPISSNEYGLYISLGSIVINCEFVSANAGGLFLGSTGCKVIYCYFHDMTDAANGLGMRTHQNTIIEFCIFDNCEFGILSASSDYCLVKNNTFYDCGIALSETDGIMWSCINNLLEACTVDGFRWTTQTDMNFFWKNHGDDARNVDMWNLVDIATVFQDYEVSAGDPQLTVPGANFTFPATSPCQDTGMSIELGVG